MDTYVHLLAGATVGSLVAEAIDAKVFGGCVLAKNETGSDGPSPWPLLSLGAAGMISGIATHVFMDGLPHTDLLVHHGLIIPDRLWPLREFIACVASMVALVGLTSGRRRLITLAAGFGGALPDVESLLIGIDLMDKASALSPTHNGTIPHGKDIGWPSALIEYGSVLLSIGLLWLKSWRGKRLLQKGHDRAPVTGAQR
jgi:hypothetical protein